MEGGNTKYLVLLCILLFAGCINSQDATTSNGENHTGALEQGLEGDIKITEFIVEPSKSYEGVDVIVAINENPNTENESQLANDNTEESNAASQSTIETTETQKEACVTTLTNFDAVTGSAETDKAIETDVNPSTEATPYESTKPLKNSSQKSKNETTTVEAENNTEATGNAETEVETTVDPPTEVDLNESSTLPYNQEVPAQEEDETVTASNQDKAEETTENLILELASDESSTTRESSASTDELTKVPLDEANADKIEETTVNHPTEENSTPSKGSSQQVSAEDETKTEDAEGNAVTADNLNKAEETTVSPPSEVELVENTTPQETSDKVVTTDEATITTVGENNAAEADEASSQAEETTASGVPPTAEETTESSNAPENIITTEDSNATPTPEIPVSVTPLTPCIEIGIFPHESNCNSYYTCNVNLDGDLERIDYACPQKSAFNIELNRCARDISSCSDEAPCQIAGSYADTQGNASYYWCVPRLTGGFHKYHIECRTGEIFISQLGRCFIDINNIQNLPLDYGQYGGEPDDEKIVKTELKQFKIAEKVKLKQQKLKEKYEQKLQKELAKKAAKDAKALEKAAGKSKEKENFICTEEGNFASALNQNHYYSCINKKGKLKALNMICTMGYAFDQESSACIAKEEESDDESESDDFN